MRKGYFQVNCSEFSRKSVVKCKILSKEYFLNVWTENKQFRNRNKKGERNVAQDSERGRGRQRERFIESDVMCTFKRTVLCNKMIIFVDWIECHIQPRTQRTAHRHKVICVCAYMFCVSSRAFLWAFLWGFTIQWHRAFVDSNSQRVCLTSLLHFAFVSVFARLFVLYSIFPILKKFQHRNVFQPFYKCWFLCRERVERKYTCKQTEMVCWRAQAHQNR